MNVLIIGSGAREHAIALAVSTSPLLTDLFVAPGNPGCSTLADCVALDIDDHRAVVDFCRRQGVGFVIVGPEAPLVAGIADALASAGVLCFGPSRAAAQLEGSKGFTKDFCREFAIPTAEYGRFADKPEALEYLRAKGAPIVVKADGLAAGKGVVVAQTLGEAEAAVESMFSGAFGAAGEEVVIEELLEGDEVSFFALCDGNRFAALASAKDHKRVGDGDTGPNTGGMGAYSPASVVTPALQRRILAEIIAPTVAGMARRGSPYRGVLFAGLMLTAAGPKLIEYNVRFGDPETEAMLARFETDLLELLLACAKGELPAAPPVLSDKSAVTVVMAARGYPGAYAKGSAIGDLGPAAATPGVTIFHAGTKLDDGALVSDGGRVLAVTALADSFARARESAYAAVAKIDWKDGFYRRDIGWKAGAPD